jgi:hypothetical protein
MPKVLSPASYSKQIRESSKACSRGLKSSRPFLASLMLVSPSRSVWRCQQCLKM